MMIKMMMILFAVALFVGVAGAQSTGFIRTEGGEGKTPSQTLALYGPNSEAWIQGFNTDAITLRGGPSQKFGHGLRVSELVSWTPNTGALAINPNLSHVNVNKEGKSFWEAGLYAPLNNASSWSLVLYDARLLKRLDTKFAAGPVTYGKWAEGAGNDALAFGLAAEYKVEGGGFYGRAAHNVVSGKNEFRLQYAFGF